MKGGISVSRKDNIEDVVSNIIEFDMNAMHPNRKYIRHFLRMKNVSDYYLKFGNDIDKEFVELLIKENVILINDELLFREE